MVGALGEQRRYANAARTMGAALAENGPAQFSIRLTPDSTGVSTGETRSATPVSRQVPSRR